VEGKLKELRQEQRKGIRHRGPAPHRRVASGPAVVRQAMTGVLPIRAQPIARVTAAIIITVEISITEVITARSSMGMPEAIAPAEAATMVPTMETITAIHRI